MGAFAVSQVVRVTRQNESYHKSEMGHESTRDKSVYMYVCVCSAPLWSNDWCF